MYDARGQCAIASITHRLLRDASIKAERKPTGFGLLAATYHVKYSRAQCLHLPWATYYDNADKHTPMRIHSFNVSTTGIESFSLF